MDHCVDKANAMFLEQYILLMMQDKLETEGELERLTKDMIDRYIDKIVVCDEQRIEIFWKENSKVCGCRS